MATPVELVLDRLREFTDYPPRPDGSGWKSKCPCHQDDTPSLGISEGDDGRALILCRAGCATASVLSELGLAMKDLFPIAEDHGNGKPKRIAATYDYTDEGGTVLFQAVRFDPKGFAQRRPVETGWEWNLQGVRRVLYRLPEILEAVAAAKTIHIVEGEKDADRLWKIGLAGTCNPMGAGKWKPQLSESLRGATVVILPDNDKAGRDHAEQVAASLHGVAAEVKILELPGLPPKGDVSNWLNAGHTREDLEALAESVAEAHTLTDLGNAERFKALHGADLRYCHQFTRWYAFDGVVWREDQTGEIVRRAVESVRSIYKEAADSRDDNQRKGLALHAKKSESRNSIENMIQLAESLPGIPLMPEQFDRNPYTFAQANGVYDLETDQFREARRDDYLTKKSPVTFDPKADCPIWQDFLETIMPGETGLIGFLQRMAGYFLTGLATEQKLFLGFGCGANGKTTLVNVLIFILGDYARRVNAELLVINQGQTHPTGLADLFGTRLAVASETEQGKRLAESLVKELTGGEKITARRMRQDFFSFDPIHKLLILTNHRPVIIGTDYAIWRRIDLIPFTVTIPPDEQDKNLFEKLKSEAAGIFNWMLEGFREWRRIGLAEPEEVTAATDSYRLEMDVLGTFLDDCCVELYDVKVKSSALRTHYETWCNANGERPIGTRGFQNRLTERGFRSVRLTDGERFWVGVGLNQSSKSLSE